MSVEYIEFVAKVGRKFVVLCALFLTFWYVISSWKRRCLVHMIDKFDGPPKLPIVGNLHYILRSQADLIDVGISWLKYYASPIRLWMGCKPYLVLTSPKDVQVVINETLDKGENLNYFKTLMGEGLITASSLKKWRQNRKTINSNFNAPFMWKQFLNSFNLDARCMLDHLDKRLHEKEIDVYGVVNSIALKSICRTAMGYSASDEELITFGHQLEGELTAVTTRYYIPFLQPDFAYNLFKVITGNRNRLKDVFHLPKKIIAETREKMTGKKENANEFEQNDKKLSENVTLVNILLKENSIGDRLSDQEILDQVITFLIAGTETVSVAISNTLLMLAVHEDVQEKLYEEIFQVFGNDGREATMEDLDKLHYLEQCLKETMRLLPSVPVIFRESSKEIVLTGGRRVPKNTPLGICIFALHRDQNEYAKPHEWNPDNFTPEKMAKRHKYSFIPFSGGPKMCLGYKYAMLSLKMNVCMVMRKYHMRSNLLMEDIQFNVMLVMKISNGYAIKFTPRHPKACAVENLIQ